MSGHHAPEIARAVRRAVERTLAALESRIAHGVRDGDVGPGLDLDPRASVVMNTVVGLRVMARAYDAATLCRCAASPAPRWR
jgi:TetR/AcrR family transcriptional repressor of nem operon